MDKNRNKTGGRQKGVTNKFTTERKERVKHWLEIIDEKYLARDIAALTPHQRVQLYTDLLEYITPKQARVTQAADPENPVKPTIIITPIGPYRHPAMSEEEVEMN